MSAVENAPEAYPIRGLDWEGTLQVWRGPDRKARRLTVLLPDGREIPVSRDEIEEGDDAFHLPVAAAQISGGEQVIPVIAERVVVRKDAVPTGSVQVRKHVETHVEHIDIPVIRENVDIRRVVIDRVVDSVPPTREEGDALIIPVVVEELVVTKRLVLKEEVHLKRIRTESRSVQDVTLRSESAEVVRTDAEGNEVRAGEPERPERVETPERSAPTRRNRILKDW
jgi:uncharacterized protein (TIGR02271 family)